MESNKSRGSGRGEKGPTENNPGISAPSRAFDEAGGVALGQGRGKGRRNRLDNPSPAGRAKKRRKGSTPSPMSTEDLISTAGMDSSRFALDQASLSQFESAEIERILGTGNNNSSITSPLSEQATNRNALSLSSPFYAQKTGGFRSPFLSSTGATQSYNLDRNFAELPKSECVYCFDGILRDKVTMKIHRQDYHRMSYERCDLPINHHLKEESQPEPDPFFCPDCGAEKKSYGDYLKCVKAHQDEMKEKKITTHVCNYVEDDGTVCGSSFPLRKGLGQHRLRETFIKC